MTAMRDFVDIGQDPAALERALVRMGLAAPGDPLRPQPLTGGVSSNIFRLDLPSGAICVKQALPQLKVQKDWRVPVERALAEMDWLEVANAIVPGRVPRLVGTDRDSGVFAMEYIVEAETWKQALLEGRVDLHFGAQVARCVAALHRATAGDERLRRKFAHDDTFYAIRLEPYLVETARQHPDLAQALMALVAATQSRPAALVHGDVSPKNILLGEAGPVLLDAECAWFGDPAFDLAFLLNHLLLKSEHLPRRREALSALFEAVVRAYLDGVDWEPRHEFERRCARLLPGLLLARVDGKSPVEYLGEESRGRVRRAAGALLRQPPADLDELLARWRECTDAGPAVS